ncbi:MAG: cyclic nucleotide-binding domain-containing protein [Betaproteobacteria bacterium]|nr:cyclic nucleotide-binding domain-containing protein [Betaproteobacteria bacterium]
MDTLTPEQVRRVEQDIAVQHVSLGGLVVRKGEPVDHWIGVLGGLVKLSSSAPDGRATTFAGVPRGGWFGEGSLLKHEPRRYEGVALSACTIARLPRSTFEWLLDSNIAFNRHLLVQLNERLAQFIGLVEYERLHDPDAKMARCIADLFNPALYPRSGPRLEISQAELALLVGVSRQRANRSLSSLERAGLLTVAYGCITVHDLPGLRSFGEAGRAGIVREPVGAELPDDARG